MQRLVLVAGAVLGIVVGIAACSDIPVQPGTVGPEVVTDRSSFNSQSMNGECVSVLAPHLKEAAHLFCRQLGGNACVLLVHIPGSTSVTTFQSPNGPVRVTITYSPQGLGTQLMVETPVREFESTLSAEEVLGLCPQAG